MTILRHNSLEKNVMYKIPKLQSWGHDGKLEILIRKTQAKK